MKEEGQGPGTWENMITATGKEGVRNLNTELSRDEKRNSGIRVQAWRDQ